MILRDLVLRRTIKSTMCVKVRNHKKPCVNKLNNGGKFCHLLHLLSRGMDLFLQVQAVTWGGGKISSTHPYNALGYQTRQLVRWLHKVRAWRPCCTTKTTVRTTGQKTGGNGQQWLAEMSSLWQPDHLPCLLCQNRNPSPPQIYVNTYSKMFPPCRMLHLYSWLGEGHVFVWLCALSLFLIWGIYMHIRKADMDFRGSSNDSIKNRWYIKSYIFKWEGT